MIRTTKNSISCIYYSIFNAGPEMDIKLKRIYEPSETNDGYRILVDRLWPRGVSRERASIDYWEKELAPSDSLRRRFHHDPSLWAEFKLRYIQELDANPGAIRRLMSIVGDRPVTFLYAARDPAFNNAIVLKAYLESALRDSSGTDLNAEHE